MYGIGRGVYDVCGLRMELIKYSVDFFFCEKKIKSGFFCVINERGVKFWRI